MPDENSLNERDQDILLQIAAGFENDEIAQRLDMSLVDLIEQLARIMNKLGAKDRHSAALTAIREGYILLEDLHSITRPSQE
jgi:two-component system competent response regulator ComA